ncbi:hypothetical protein [Salinibacillus aidingensis]|uniref:hypothetical protein n=1 Tax=Salinibacillus aidingensis TaxID=237684 RepID=UPI0031D30FC8
MSVIALFIFIVCVSFVTEEEVKPEESSEDLTLEEINAKYEKKEERFRKLYDQKVIKTLNKEVLKEFKSNFGMNLEGYVFKEIDTFSKDFLTKYFSERVYHPRYTFAYISKQKNDGYILDKRPETGINTLFHISRSSNQWEVTKMEEKNGRIYTYDFIRTIEQKIESKIKNEK